MSYEILVINPGSTSTKIGVFTDEKLLFDVTLRHSAEELAPYATIADQKDFRKALVLNALKVKEYDAKNLSAVSARGGLVAPIPGGTYAVNDRLLADCAMGVQGQHASNLGALIAHEIGEELGIPAFVVAPVFGLTLGMNVPGLSVAGWDNPLCAVLPALTLGLINAAYIARLTRGGMAEVLSADFIRTARAKGAGAGRLLFVHALRSGLLPAVSYLGPAFAALITGSFVVETCFQVPGMGLHFVNATTDRDYFLIQGLVFCYGVLIVLANLVVDLVLIALNPQLRSQGAA